jgi:GWxTD domain-containing protein
MGDLFLESTLRGVLIAAGTWAIVSAMRIRMPATLHAIWTGVMIAMLLLPLTTAWAPKAPVQVLPQAQASSRVSAEAQTIGSANPVRGGQTRQETPRPIAAPVARWTWRDAVLFVYALVASALLVRLAFGTLRTYRLVRRSVVLDGRLTNAACASPVTVGLLRPVVILPEAWREWSHAKLRAVLVHEQAHARRRDPLVQWLALLNRAVFWFNPLAWWLERRLSSLAEQTCDDAVLADGHDPRDYSEYLLDTARAVGAKGRLNLAGAFMPGAFLPLRIRRILDTVPTARVSRARLISAVAACAIVSTVFVVVLPVRAASQRATGQPRLIVRPVQPRWIPPDSPQPQPVSLEWLDGDEWAFEMQSISTADELLAYSRLRTKPERDAFIARFWERRDPTPGTPVNEFRDEFVRRVQFARERLADPQSAGTAGFDTDRGRVYLMFGQPDAIEAQGSGRDRSEIWRYDDIAALGGQFRVRFSSARGAFCGYRIVSPAPLAQVGGVDAPTQRTRLQFYPLGLVAISIPVDANRVVGARWELRNHLGVQVDEGEIGFMDGRKTDPLSQHLSAAWLDMGIGCTHALPPDTYELITVVRFIDGDFASEKTTFNMQ